MTDIQRYGVNISVAGNVIGYNPNGEWVRYTDHVEAVKRERLIAFVEGQEKEREMAAPGIALAVKQAEQRGREFVLSVWKQNGYDEEKRMAHMYEQGQRDAMTGTGVALYELGQRDAQAKHADCICSDTAAIYRVDGKVVSIGLTDEAGGVFERREDVLNEAVQRVEALPFIHREAVIAAIKGDSDE